MPKLSSDQVPQVRLHTGALPIEVSLTRDQRRGLWERPGTTVVAIVELTAVEYTGVRPDDDKKGPTVRVRVTGCEVARDDDEATTLLEASRAMWRRRKLDGTFDEVGQTVIPEVDAIVRARFGPYASEDEVERRRREHRDD